MRRIVLLTMIALLAVVSIQGQTKQQGVAYRYNGKQQRTPLGNVTISYDADKRSTLSNENDGTFTLLLDGRKMGDRIGLVTVRKREMMVFNQQAVDEWSIRKEPLCLILCNADEFERQKENLINIGKREAKKKYDRQKAELEAKLSASQMKQQEYEAALDKAYDELERFQKKVGKYAGIFARIDESDLDTLAQRALELFNQGEVDEAIRLFEEGHYMDKLDKAMKNSQQADQLKAIAEQGKEQAIQDSLKALQSLKAQIEAYKMNNEWAKAGKLLKGLADRLNTVDECWKYAYFCYDQNNFKDAEDYYHRAISLLNKQEDKETLDNLFKKGHLQNNLARLYCSIQRLTESEAMYKEALEIFHLLALPNPQTYEPDVAMTLNNLANMYVDTQRFTESEAMYKEALEAYRRLAQSNPQAYEPNVALTLNNLANLYRDTHRFTEGEAMYKEALKTYRHFFQSTPHVYDPEVAMTLNNLALLNCSTHCFTEGETMFKEALETYRRLAQSNPQAYEPYVAGALNNLAILYKNTLRFTESEAMYKEALEIYRRLALSSPKAYELDVARTNYNLGLLYKDLEKSAEAIPRFEEASVLFRRLAHENPIQQQFYENCLFYLYQLYGGVKDYLAAYHLYQEWLPIMKKNYEANPESQQRDYAANLCNQSFFCFFAKQYAEAEQYAREGLAVDSTQHWIAANLASALLFQGRYKEAEQIYRQYKDELKDSILDDFNQFAEAGVIPKKYEADVEKIKKILMSEK